MTAVDNRRTMCDHCSLRADLPSFIGRDHAQGNADRITQGDIFSCHLIHVPGEKARACLGAALIAGVELANGVAANQPPVHESLESYVEGQARGRKTTQWLQDHGEQWVDTHGSTWYGWWQPSVAARDWFYLMSTLEGNDLDSVYLFFDQAQQVYGPLERKDD